MLLSFCVHGVLSASTRGNEKQGHPFLAPESLFSHLFSLWDVLYERTFFQAFSHYLLAPTQVLRHHKSVISYRETAR